MNSTELAVNRRNTAAFISADPHTVVLTPRKKVKTNTGGTTWEKQPPRNPQIFKVIEGSGGLSRFGEGKVPGGTAQETEYMLLGAWDSTIGDHDVFDYRDDQWEVVEVMWNNGYEQRARVRQYAG